MGQFTFLKFIQDQWWKVTPVEHVDLTGKTVVVIGANVGLGFEAAKHFASMNPKRLVLGCRNQEKGQAALEAIQATGFTNAELSLVDLAQFASVSTFADAFIRDNAQIDILVYNAAVLMHHYSPSKDGWEESIQVNHLSAMLLTTLLFPCLLKAVSSGTSPNPRVVIVSSEAHFWAKFTKAEVESDKILQKISDKSHCTSQVMHERYPLSKLLNVFFVRELTKRLPANSPVIVAAVNPGFCKSQLGRNLSPVYRMVGKMIQALLARTTEEGSRQLVWAAVGGVGREFELRGGYVNMANLEEVSDYALSDEGAAVQTRLWDESVEILSGVEPKFESTLREILSS
jgi:NAD(P)-dependent dehydrogenase (short-subunit alcohol dehydrogenase family)